MAKTRPHRQCNDSGSKDPYEESKNWFKNLSGKQREKLRREHIPGVAMLTLEYSPTAIKQIYKNEQAKNP